MWISGFQCNAAQIVDVLSIIDAWYGTLEYYVNGKIYLFEKLSPLLLNL